MASAGMIYRNYNSTDTTSQGLTISELPQPPASWEREGYFFKEWNTSRDGSGTSLQPGDGIPVTGEAYAIWYGDYIEAVKDSSGIEHPIKDTISGYIVPLTVNIFYGEEGPTIDTDFATVKDAINNEIPINVFVKFFSGGKTYNATIEKHYLQNKIFYYVEASNGFYIYTQTANDFTVTEYRYPTKVSDLTNDVGYITSAPITSVNGQTGAVTTAEKFVITATAISGTEYYNLDKTYADIVSAIGQNKYVSITDIDATYPYTTIVSQGIVFGATLITTGEGNQLVAVTDGILAVQPDSGTNAMGIAVHSLNVLPTASDIPSASSTAPSMDGTADVGIQTTYARADHVHPTDTSRQAVLVSGTNIKTINNESILGSGNISISGGASSIILEGTYTTPSNLYVQKTPTELYNYLGAGTVVYIKGIYDDEDPYFRQRTNSLYRLNSVELQGEGNNSFYKASITSHPNVIGDNDTIIVYGYASGQTSDTSVAFTLMPIETDSANATNSTSKLFLVGATSQTASPDTYSNSNVYATNGVLNAKSFSVDASANIVYNSSSKSIDFTFV